MRVEQLLGDSALRLSRKAAIVAGRASHTYADLDRKSDRLATAMAGRGVKRGDRIALFLDNSFAAVVAVFAALKAGAVLCPIDPRAPGDDLATWLNERRAVGIVTEARLGSAAARALCSATTVKIVVLVGGDRSSAQGNCLSFEDIVGRFGDAVRLAPAGDGADPAFVVPTAGEDGEVGSQTFTHDELIQAASVAVTGEEAIVVAAPIAAHAGFCQMLGAVRAGATLVLESPFTGRASLVGFGADAADTRLALAG